MVIKKIKELDQNLKKAQLNYNFLLHKKIYYIHHQDSTTQQWEYQIGLRTVKNKQRTDLEMRLTAVKSLDSCIPHECERV